MTAKKRTAILISGRGSNLQALIEAAADPAYSAQIALVLSNVADAPGLARAATAGIPTKTVSHRGHATRESFDGEIEKALRQDGIELVCLAGFMRVLSDTFVRNWEGRLINIHPSLLPAFKGLHVHRQVLDAGVRISGCTVHFVVPEIDSGAIIAQAAVPVFADDNEETLAARTLDAEHRLYPLALELLAGGRVALENGRARFTGMPANTGALFNPLA
ncbi:MAG TPA: phosphoribosylglycinamide formyltransferase [Rhizomicrobium sp.]|nr:phosphoribosylglycinamide formyltransferase [Rhizomicrobium sp.]